MTMLRISSGTEQVASFLKQGLIERKWSGTMPGRDKLAHELGVNRKTIDSALRQLEQEGILHSQGPRRRRTICMPDDLLEKSSLRVAILPGDAADIRAEYILTLQHRLSEAGHHVVYASHTLSELRMNTQRLGRLVDTTQADAWVVVGGSREILEWFSTSKLPTFAMFGRRNGVPIASIGPDKAPAYAAATKRLIELGHRRIVMITKKARRLPVPGKPESAFLDQLKANGIMTGSYNLPDWEESIDGLYRCLDSIFQITPPTAMIIDEPFLYQAVQHYLARRGILAPEHISLICSDADPHFDWQRPSVAHIDWHSAPWIRRVVRWASNISRNKLDTQASSTRAEFIEGGTIGPCPRS